MVERSLEKSLDGIVTVKEMQFCFMPERRTIDYMYMLRRLQEDYDVKGKKLYVFCGPRENFSQSANESVGMGNEEERITRSFG